MKFVMGFMKEYRFGLLQKKYFTTSFIMASLRLHIRANASAGLDQVKKFIPYKKFKAKEMGRNG
jgi:hypothetical protein